MVHVGEAERPLTHADPASDLLQGSPVPDATWVDIAPFGIAVTPITAPDVASIVATAPGKRLLLNHNLHSVYLHDTDTDFQRLYEQADWTIIDGTSVLWLASLFSRRWFPTTHRTGSTDWLRALDQLDVSRRLFVLSLIHI